MPARIPFLLLFVMLYTSASGQGTITLNLATSDDETARTISIPFQTLFDASDAPEAISIQVTSGKDIAIDQDDITCQCFADRAGTKLLGERFTNVLPGTRLGQEPVQIGAIFCADEEGVEKQSAGATRVEGENLAPPAVTGKPKESKSPGTGNQQYVSASEEKGPTAVVKFALSDDASDNTSTQMSVPIDNSITSTSNDRVADVVLFSISGAQLGPSERVLCQMFADGEARKPLQSGFGLDEELVLGGIQTMSAVGCAVVGTGGFGGTLGLIGVSQ